MDNGGRAEGSDKGRSGTRETQCKHGGKCTRNIEGENKEELEESSEAEGDDGDR